MPHLVKYRTADGRHADHEVADLAGAIAHVERLRNEEGVTQARIFTIEEVDFEFKPYFKVELGGAARRPAPAPARPKVPVAAEPTADEADVPVAPAWVPPVAEPVIEAPATSDAPVASGPEPKRETVPAGNGASRRGLFGR